jgi:hypothetical protein
MGSSNISTTNKQKLTFYLPITGAAMGFNSSALYATSSDPNAQ